MQSTCSIRWLIAKPKEVNAENRELKRRAVQILVLCFIFLCCFIGARIQFPCNSYTIHMICLIVMFVSGFILIFGWERKGNDALVLNKLLDKTPLKRMFSWTDFVVSISFGLSVFTEITLFILAFIVFWFIGKLIIFFFFRKKTKICEYGKKFYVMRYKWLDGWVWVKPSEISAECKCPDANTMDQYLCDNVEKAKEIVANLKRHEHLKG